jgi:xylulokinase
MAEMMYMAGMDIGTTGVKTIITDVNGNAMGMAYREYPCTYPHPGWVEQDVDVMWDRICETTNEVISKNGIDPRAIKSLGISSQRGTFIPVDKEMRPLGRSIVWADVRADREVEWIKKDIGEVRFHEITGVPLSGMWAYPKMKWYIDNGNAMFEKTYKILNGQEYFLFKLGAEDLSTDPASITLNGMMDIEKLDWSKELCERIGLPLEKLPPMGTTARQVGEISKKSSEETGFMKGMPISIGAGDQQCAAIGAGIVREGMAEITIGTGMVIVAHIDTRRRDPNRKVLIGGSGIPRKWNMEGINYTSGAALRWWRDVYGGEELRCAGELGLDVYDLITLEASKSPPGSKGFIFFPCFQGQCTPYYHDFARGGSIGLSFIHDKKDMARAILEGVTFEINMVIAAMEEVMEKKFDVLRISGGGSKSHLWNQIQSDVYGRAVERLRVSECATIGAAILGAVGCKIFPSVEEAVSKMVHTYDTVEPDLRNHAMYTEGFQLFREVFETLMKNNLYRKIADYQNKYWG